MLYADRLKFTEISTGHNIIDTLTINVTDHYKIKTQGRVSATKKDMQYTSVLFTQLIKLSISTSYVYITQTYWANFHQIYKFISFIHRTSHNNFERNS